MDLITAYPTNASTTAEKENVELKKMAAKAILGIKVLKKAFEKTLSPVLVATGLRGSVRGLILTAASLSLL